MKRRDKYYQGYTLYNVPQKNGKSKKTIRVYEGDIYRMDATDGQRIRKKWLCAVLILIFFIMGLMAGFQNVEANKGYASIPYVATLLFGLYCGLGVINLLICNKDMTEFEYREYSKQIGSGSAMSMYTMGVATLIYLVFLIIKLVGGEAENQSVGSELFALLCGCICCGCVAGIRWIEKNSKYIVIPGELSEKTDKDDGEDDIDSGKGFNDIESTN